LASEKEQGRAFGILEGGRNSVDMVTGAILLAVFAYRGADDDALSEQIFIYATFALILALIVWLIMKDDTTPRNDGQEVQATLTVAVSLRLLNYPSSG
jgi:sugar phosphate permease